MNHGGDGVVHDPAASSCSPSATGLLMKGDAWKLTEWCGLWGPGEEQDASPTSSGIRFGQIRCPNFGKVIFYHCKPSSTQASSVWKTKQAISQKEQRFPKEKENRECYPGLLRASPTRKEESEVPHAHAVLVSEAVMKWGSQSSSFPRGQSGSPPARALTLPMAFPKPHK